MWSLSAAAAVTRTISVADVGLRCYSCFNEETAALIGVDFDNTPLQPVTVSDADGDDHTFEFRPMLVGTGHALYARERLPEGEILVDHARRKRAGKRGGAVTVVGLDMVPPRAEPYTGAAEVDILALDRALEELASFDAENASG